jgi:cell division protein FtsB
MERDYFGQIAQALRSQKELMDRLEAENRELRAQLETLRSGAGICVEIAGRRFALRGSSSLATR